MPQVHWKDNHGRTNLLWHCSCLIVFNILFHVWNHIAQGIWSQLSNSVMVEAMYRWLELQRYTLLAG